MRTAVLISLALGLCACGAQSELSAAEWTALADRAFAEGDRVESLAPATASSDAEADKAVDASKHYLKAAASYARAFALEDPIPERAEVRALLAFRRGRAIAKVVHIDPLHPWSQGRSEMALLWLEQAHRLRPSLRQAHFERARLYDSSVAGVRDTEKARLAYAAYLDAVDPQDVPESERPRYEHAKQRHEALSDALDAEPPK